jgi:ATP-binding protein involved in chromosome partitioning
LQTVSSFNKTLRMNVENVLKALSTVQEPDLGKDLVTLNMIRDIVISGTDLSFTIALTTPACPLKDLIKKSCIQAIHKLVGNDINVSIHFISEMKTKPIAPENVLPKVKNIIAVVSGKGGVGKSTVASNLALALAADGASVGLMDADIYGPSLPIMFGVRGERPMMKTVEGKGMILPLVKYGIKLMSIGFLIDEKNAVVWRGPMASSAIKQFVSEVFWDDLDYLVIDMPPGTGDIHLTIMQSVSVTGVIVVSTPQDVALADAKKAIAMFAQAQLKAPIIGLVENMSYFVAEETPSHKYYIFGKDGGKRLAEEYSIPFLGQIPLIQRIREGGDEGKPVMISEDTVSKRAFQDFTGNAVRSIAMINANINVAKRAELVDV